MPVVMLYVYGLFFLVLAGVVQAQAQAQSAPTSIDGSCMELAILVEAGADYDKCDNIFCVAGEYKKNRDKEHEFISKKFGQQGKDWELVSKQMREEYDRTYDLVTIKIKATGEEKDIYFNITDARARSEEALANLKARKR